MKKKAFVYYIFIIMLFSCNYRQDEIGTFHGLNGYLFVANYYPGYEYSVFDLKNRRHTFFPNTKSTHNEIPGYRLIISKENDHLYSIDNIYDTIKKTKVNESILYLYSFKSFKIEKKYIIKDFKIEDYQVIDGIVYASDNNSIIKWNLATDEKETIYYTSDYISSFHVFPFYKRLITEELKFTSEMKGKIKYTSSETNLYAIDLQNNVKVKIDSGQGACYSDEYSRIIYNGRKEGKIKYYDLATTKFKVIDVLAYEMNPSCAFVTDNVVVIHKRRNTLRNYFNLPGSDDTAYILYNIETKEQATILEGQADASILAIQFTEIDLSFLFADITEKT